MMDDIIQDVMRKREYSILHKYIKEQVYEFY